jgi:hypothetical protein
MTDDSPTSPEACSTGSGFYVPGTHDVACNDDHVAHLQHCAHCGATLSMNSEFCQVCATAVSGGEEVAADTTAADADTAVDAETAVDADTAADADHAAAPGQPES